MAKIQTEIKFGNESSEKLIDELIKDKMKEVTNMLKSGEITSYKQKENHPSINIDKKVDEGK